MSFPVSGKPRSGSGGGTALGTGLLSLTAVRSHVLFSGPCSEEETELAEPGQAAVA